MTNFKLDQSKAPYLQALSDFASNGHLRLIVPGHAGGEGVDPQLLDEFGLHAFQMDIPQDQPGIDVGPSPTPYAQAEALAADAYGAGRSWFLTNGATQGNHATCLALATTGKELIVQRNCHGSVIDGLVLSGGTPRFIAPEQDEQLGMATVVSVDTVREAVAKHPNAVGVLIVSPTYFGVVADIEGCAKVAHDAGMLLIVDGAWGPHFGFNDKLPETPMRQGADIVLTSTHKHGGSLTQSAILHVAAGREREQAELERAMRMLRSTSPSSLLMGSLDGARRQLATEGQRLFDVVLGKLESLADGIDAVDGYRVVRPGDDRGAAVAGRDPLRMVVDVRESGFSGLEILYRLRAELDINVELATHSTLVMVFGPQLPDAWVSRIPEALKALGRGDFDAGMRPTPPPAGAPQAAMTPREAYQSEHEAVSPDDAVGRVSAEAISGYPPGIPAILPGEVVTQEAITHLQTLRVAKVRLHGASDPEFQTMLVVAN